MGRMTFVFEFEDGKEPEIKEEMHFIAGKVVAASDADLVHAVMVMDKKINEYKTREKALLDKLNDHGEPLTRKEVLLLLAPIVLVSLFSLLGVVFGLPAFIRFLFSFAW